MIIYFVVGTRPNFVKLSPIIREANKFSDIKYKIIHTGQHYDYFMSDSFFKDMIIPYPDINLEIGSNTHATSVAKIMIKLENIFLKDKPDIVVVIGDVNSSLAASLVVSKINDIKLAHIESGCRSYDKTMPEEINRIIIDSVSDFLFCPDINSVYNLYREGYNSNIYLVGNTSIDNIKYYKNNIKNKEKIILITIHRQSNVDNIDNLSKIFKILNKIDDNNILFPIHPRTLKKVKEIFGDEIPKYIVDPLSYIDFISYLKNSELVITDSGGIQVESTFFNVPCITLRENTEWQFTIDNGTNILSKIDEISFFENMKKVKNKKCKNIEIFKNNASEKIIRILREEK